MIVNIRAARASDKSFIYSTWLLGLYYGNETFNVMERKSFFVHYKPIVERYLSLATIEVACLPDDDDVVLGYIVYRGGSLDWLFVKKPWRKLGIAKSLMKSDFASCSHITKIGKSLKPKTMEYNPFL